METDEFRFGVQDNGGVSLLAFQPPPGPRWPLATQAALSVAAPIAIMTLLGRPTLGYVAAAGAFTVLYKSGLSTKDRARALPLVALTLTLCAAAGAVSAGNAWLVAIGLIVTTVVTSTLTVASRLGAPGAVFFPLVYGLSAQVVGGERWSTRSRSGPAACSRTCWR